MEVASDDDEEGEEDKLYKQTNDNDLLARVER
jgi:hypothetical protein